MQLGGHVYAYIYTINDSHHSDAVISNRLLFSFKEKTRMYTDTVCTLYSRATVLASLRHIDFAFVVRGQIY